MEKESKKKYLFNNFVAFNFVLEYHFDEVGKYSLESHHYHQPLEPIQCFQYRHPVYPIPNLALEDAVSLLVWFTFKFQ